MNNTFDPIDLVMLGVGFAQGAAHRANTVSEERAGYLVGVARMLERLWLEVDASEWGGVWAYEVAEPLGYWIGEAYLVDEELPSTVDVEKRARQLIEDAT